MARRPCKRLTFRGTRAGSSLHPARPDELTQAEQDDLQYQVVEAEHQARYAAENHAYDCEEAISSAVHAAMLADMEAAPRLHRVTYTRPTPRPEAERQAIRELLLALGQPADLLPF